MKNRLLILLAYVFVLGCSEEKTDEYMLEQDRKQLQEELDKDKIHLYKGLKIAIRSNAVQDTSAPEMQDFMNRARIAAKKIIPIEADSIEDMSVKDYIALYHDYRVVKKLVKETDEDIFPTLYESFLLFFFPGRVDTEIMTGERKILAQNYEHLLLSLMALSGKTFSTDISLYECSKSSPDLLEDKEAAAATRIVRSLLFLKYELYYLSENELTKNIDWLNENPDIPMDGIRYIFGKQLHTDRETHLAFHGMNHLLRGLDRSMMERDIDEERAMQDFEAFLHDAEELQLENELVWSVAAYYYLNKEDSEKAIEALTKLKGSPLLSDREKDTIDEAIEYLEDRKPGKVLNGVYDKYFLTKISLKYIFAVLADVNWKKVLDEAGVEHVDEIFKALDAVDEYNRKMEEYTSTEKLKEKGKELQEEGDKLLDKAKDWWNSDEKEEE